MQRALELSPTLLTITGLDTGPLAKARRQLDNRSPTGAAQLQVVFQQLQRDLSAYDPGQLSKNDWINHQSAELLVRDTLDSFTFGYGDPNAGIAAPYIVSQLSGSYRQIPSFLATQHPVRTAEDADAYLSRLGAFATLIDQESERVRSDFARDVVPPTFVLEASIRQFDALLASKPDQSELVLALTKRAAAANIAGPWEKDAAAIVDRQVFPALDRQRAILRAALPHSNANAGVWDLPEADRYYRYAISAATTTNLPPDEIHHLGLELVGEFSAKADAELRKEGLSQGSVVDRLAVLRNRADQLYPNTDEGRTELLKDLEKALARVNAVLPAWFGSLPKSRVDIVRMPPSIETGASGATYQPPALDGSRPGLFSINLRDLNEWPRFELPTLVFHEAVPGHHLQNALMTEAPGLPLLRRMPIYSGYSEGWALYAEQLADEMGLYRDDRLARLGYLASMLFRATRLVVDTGIHSKRWSRAESIAYMSKSLGGNLGSIEREVDRYCVQPGQALSYMLGWKVWTGARDAAQKRLGGKFDIKRFHDAGLLSGSMPLDVLAKVLASV